MGRTVPQPIQPPRNRGSSTAKALDLGRTAGPATPGAAPPVKTLPSSKDKVRALDVGRTLPPSSPTEPPAPPPASTSEQQYLAALRAVYQDQVVSSDERAMLLSLRERLSIDAAAAERLEQVVLGESDRRPGAAAPADLSVGSLLRGRYLITKPLGRGGMGVVYKATDKETHAEYAVKVLVPELSRDPQALADLRREVAIAQKLGHPNLLRINYLDTDGTTAFIVMEFVEGEELEAYRLRKGGRLSGSEFKEVMAQVLAGLDHLHSQGIVHLDLKPQNLMISGGGAVKLTDFGISKSIREQLQARSRGEMPVGTLCYMAPEQLRQEVCDPRTDIYALGIMSHQLLTGEFPFPVTSREEIVGWHLGPEYDGSRLRGGWGRLVEQCLARNPADRFASCREFLTELATLRPADLQRAPTRRRVVEDSPAEGADGLEESRDPGEPATNDESPPRRRGRSRGAKPGRLHCLNCGEEGVQETTASRLKLLNQQAAGCLMIGCWPVWLFLALARRPCYHCPACGTYSEDVGAGPQ